MGYADAVRRGVCPPPPKEDDSGEGCRRKEPWRTCQARLRREAIRDAFNWAQADGANTLNGYIAYCESTFGDYHGEIPTKQQTREKVAMIKACIVEAKRMFSKLPRPDPRQPKGNPMNDPGFRTLLDYFSKGAQQ